MEANNDQLQKVISALAAVGSPKLPDTIEEYRAAMYNALYELARQGVIPPEIKLDVTVAREESNWTTAHKSGTWAVRFSDDFNAWMSGLDSR